jgi:hypothetical protein
MFGSEDPRLRKEEKPWGFPAAGNGMGPGLENHISKWLDSVEEIQR